MGMTIAEKTLARCAGLESVKAGQYVDAKVERIIADEEFHRIHASAVNGGLKDGVPKVWDTERVHVVLEHFQPPLNDTQAERSRMIRGVIKKYGIKYFQDTQCAVIHQIAIEDYALPGELCLGTDSHSTGWGAINSVSTGMGEHELAYAMCFGEIWFKVPESIKIVLTGKLSKYADPKDIVFYIAKNYTASFGLYKSLEFTGPGAHDLSIANRITIAAHAVELGAKFCVFEYDEKTTEFLAQRKELKDKVSAAIPVYADPDAEYERVIEINLNDIQPYVVCPHSFENVHDIADVSGTPIHQALVGSCVNGRLEDIRAVAGVLKGHTINRNTRMFIQPASWTVYRQAMHEGLFDIILESGAQILSPGCHLCLGMQARLGNGENVITCTTRNHKGRLGGQGSKIFLANPKVIAAAAIAGEIVDIREVF